jgi:tetratricopeptide (TPR) repeat protein
MLLHDQGDLEGAEGQYRQALANYDKSLPPDHQWRASALMHLARLLVDRNQAAEALALSEESLKIWVATSPASSPSTAQAHSIHAYALARLGRRREAAEELAPAVQRLVTARGPDDPAVRRAQNWLSNVRADSRETAAVGPPAGAYPPRKIL